MRGAGCYGKALGLMLLPFALIMKEPDLGSALGAVAHRAGNAVCRRSTQALFGPAHGGVGILAALFLADIFFTPPGWWQIKLENYQRQRLLVYFGVDFAPANASPEEKAKARGLQRQKSYQVRQALISVGSGGLWEKAGTAGSKRPWASCRRGRHIMISFSPSLPRRKDSSAALSC